MNTEMKIAKKLENKLAKQAKKEEKKIKRAKVEVTEIKEETAKEIKVNINNKLSSF